MNIVKVEDYAPAILKLLTGVLSSDDGQAWERLRNHEAEVRQYFERIGLELSIHRQDGYAYISQPEVDEDGADLGLPRVTRRIPLTYDQTMLCILLRERLDDFDSTVQDSTQLVLSFITVFEMMEPYIRKHKDDIRKVEDQVRRIIRRMTRLGFLRAIGDSDEYIVQRVIQARVTAEQIAGLKSKLLAFAGLDQTTGDDEDDLE